MVLAAAVEPLFNSLVCALWPQCHMFLLGAMKGAVAGLQIPGWVLWVFNRSAPDRPEGQGHIASFLAAYYYASCIRGP